ncbi:hypothetical protein J6590_035177 [Homalodisca vitripennis]|nr:hypothetical protein J6590_035177 [Homalodisca vitripennis]
MDAELELLELALSPTQPQILLMTDIRKSGDIYSDELGALPRPIPLTPPVPSRLTPSMTIDRFPASSASALDSNKQ